jgi:hypothetical protein
MKLKILALGLVLSLGACAPKAIPTPTPLPEITSGPQCTVAYPKGFKVRKGTKKRPVNVCKDGDLEATWGGCVLRYRA